MVDDDGCGQMINRSSGERAIMSLVLPTYVADILEITFFPVETFSVRTGILCHI